MDGWAPLAPSKPNSSSNSYSNHKSTSSISNPTSSNSNKSKNRFSFAGLSSNNSNSLTNSSGGSKNLYSRASLSLSPNDPSKRHHHHQQLNGGVPSPTSPSAPSNLDDGIQRVGPLPFSIVELILFYLPLPDLLSCSLAGRDLARVVTNDEIWLIRVEALKWNKVDGIIVQDLPDLTSLGSRVQQSINPNSNSISKPQPMATAPEDDFGDFNSGDDSFGDFSSSAPSPSFPIGGSLASGMASVSLAGQSSTSHAYNSNSRSGAPSSASPFKSSFTPLTPTRPGQLQSQPKSSVFSYSSEVKLPIPSGPGFNALKAYTLALKPFYRELKSCSKGSTSSILPEINLRSQVSLVGNLARFVSFPILGCSSSISTSIWEKVNELASYLESLLLAAFEGADARRSDAIKATKHGADTEKAVKRAEEDMKNHADLLWELGRSIEGEEKARRFNRFGGNGKREWENENGRDIDQIQDENQNFTLGFDDETEMAFGNLKNSESGKGVVAAKRFLEKRGIFQGHKTKGHDPLANIISASGSPALDFTAMDKFMSEVLDQVKEEGSLIARVFPADQDVLLAYADRVAVEVISEYVTPLLHSAAKINAHLYLRACAATFTQALRLVETLLSIEPKSKVVSKERCEDVVYRMWEANMDEYLKEEKEWVKEEMEKVCEKWEQDLENQNAASRMDAAFVGSHNPAAVKRSVLTGFKDVLLLPVTVVPRTAGYVGGAVVRTAGAGLSQLNPLRWQAGSATAKGSSPIPGASTPGGGVASTGTFKTEKDSEKGYMDFSNGGPVSGMDEEEEEFDEKTDTSFGNNQGFSSPMGEVNDWNPDVDGWGELASERPTSLASSSMSRSASSSFQPSKSNRTTSTSLAPPSSGRQTPSSNPTSRSTTPQPRAASNNRQVSNSSVSDSTSKTKAQHLTRLQLLLSIDTALQLIHINRDCLKRIETFAKYPGKYGHRVREEIEEIAVIFFHCLGERHVSPGFVKATNQIKDWNPAEHEKERKLEKENQMTEKGNDDEEEKEEPVAPLVHFFELVHVGDTIQQMVQVYYDQELSAHIDRTDFLNGVVREKKRFEGALDESVASGLNAGVDLLMSQAEHIVTTRQVPRDFYPEENVDMDLGNPTKACAECCECLRTHCRMLIGSTDKNVLEVFYEEVGMRLHSIICKHLKRQIISLTGGFKVIADLNAYHSFVSKTLRQPSITSYFDSLKMLGNVYIIDSPKELAQVVRDASMFGGTLSPEDLYEFLQARCDFKAIEKAVDKEMYGFKVSEDCVIC